MISISRSAGALAADDTDLLVGSMDFAASLLLLLESLQPITDSVGFFSKSESVVSHYASVTHTPGADELSSQIWRAKLTRSWVFLRIRQARSMAAIIQGNQQEGRMQAGTPPCVAFRSLGRLSQYSLFGVLFLTR